MSNLTGQITCWERQTRHLLKFIINCVYVHSSAISSTVHPIEIEMNICIHYLTAYEFDKVKHGAPALNYVKWGEQEVQIDDK